MNSDVHCMNESVKKFSIGGRGGGRGGGDAEPLFGMGDEQGILLDIVGETFGV